jgi:hypothetical protein
VQKFQWKSIVECKTRIACKLTSFGAIVIANTNSSAQSLSKTIHIVRISVFVNKFELKDGKYSAINDRQVQYNSKYAAS